MTRRCFVGYNVSMFALRVSLSLCLCVLYLSSCLTTDVSRSKTTKDLIDTGHEHSVPAHFWSPEQRKISSIHSFLVGEYSYLKGDITTSHAAFAKAYSLDPNPYSGGKAIYTLAEMGHVDRALLEAKKMVLLHPKDAYLHYLHGQILFRAGYLDKAKEELEESLALNSSFVASYHSLIDLYILQNKLYDALAIAKEMVHEIPSAVYGWSKLSRIYMLLGEKKSALQAAKTAFKMRNTDPQLTLIYAYILELNGFSSEAISMYERLYHANIIDEHLVMHLASLYRRLGGLEDALELLDALASHATKISIGVEMQRVAILWEMKNYKRANEILLKILQAHPQASRILFFTALSEERLGKDKSAIRRFKQLLDEQELENPARFHLALIYEKRKEYALAISELQKLISGSQKKWQFFVLLASVYDKQQNFSMALKTVKHSLKLYPHNVRLLFLLGVYQEKTGDVGGCIETMKQVIKLDPLQSNAYNYLGYLLAVSGIDLYKALEYVQSALKIKPTNGHYLDSLAWVYYKLGNYAEAHLNILKALRQYPEEPIILEHYADILLQLGHIDKALVIYKKAVEFFEQAKDKKRIQKKVRGLESSS